MQNDNDKRIPDPRSGHVCCRLKNSIFIWGGYNDVRVLVHISCPNQFNCLKKKLKERIVEGDEIQFRTIYMNPSLIWFYYPMAEKW